MSKLDETTERELEAMDEAIERGRVTAATDFERELQEIALAVALEAPEADPAFSAELRERVREGFPREERRSRLSLPSLPKLRRPPMIALAGVASVLAALAVAVPLLSGGREDGRSASSAGGGAGDSAGGAALPEMSEAPRNSTLPADGFPPMSGADDQVEQQNRFRGLAAQGGPGGFAPGQRERRIERSAALTIEAPEGKLDRVAEEIATVTNRYEGFVLRSNVTSGDNGLPGGEFELRIPAERLQAALRDLSKLGDVRSRTQSGDDVTTAFVSAEDRLEGARAERRSLLRRLENAETDTQAESIRSRLDFIASEISGLRGQLRDLRVRTNYANVNVSLDQNSQAGDDDGSGASGDGLRGALDDALGSLSDSVEILVRALGVLIPIALLAALLWVGGRAARRRRREAALSI